MEDVVEAQYEGPQTTALVQTLPQFVMTTEEAKKRLAEFQDFVKSCMKDGMDFGIIPGTPKPTLYKPGAEKLCEMYGLAITIDTSHKVEDWEHGFFHYEVHCQLVSRRTGEVVAEGVGSCNSKEARYRWRWAPEDEVPAYLDKSKLAKKGGHKWVFERDIPAGTDKATLPKREGISKKTGRPYTQYDIGQFMYRIENDDIYTLVNTILKMAKKRALIDAVLSATRSSGLFTQDIEDIKGYDPDDEENAPPPPLTEEKKAAPRAQADTADKPSPVTPAQRKEMADLAKLANLAVADVQAMMREQFGVGDSKSLTHEQADQFIAYLKALANPAAAAAGGQAQFELSEIDGPQK